MLILTNLISLFKKVHGLSCFFQLMALKRAEIMVIKSRSYQKRLKLHLLQSNQSGLEISDRMKKLYVYTTIPIKMGLAFQ